MATPRIRITAADGARLVAMARAGLPNEMCGLLYGPEPANWASDAIDVSGFRPVTNGAASPTSFVLDPVRMLEAEREIEDGGSSIVGVVHSHPTTQAAPSARDLRDAATYDPRSVWLQLIVSLQGFAPTMRAWRFGHDGGSDPTELRLDVHTT